MDRFEHRDITWFDFEGIPLDRDVNLVDECWLDDYQHYLRRLVRGEGPEPVGYIAPACFTHVHERSAELWWLPNIATRFHRLPILFPKDVFVAGVEAWNWDENPHVFVRKGWIDRLYHRPFSAFAMIDVIGIKSALRDCSLTDEKLISLRGRIDAISDARKELSVLSFADSILLKTNWRVGTHDSEVGYSYSPENLLKALPEFFSAIEEELGLGCYCIVTQGFNQYPDPAPISLSTSARHVSLNSLGVPFAHLLQIDCAVRKSLHQKAHEPADLYLDEDFFFSLNMQLDFDRDALARVPYETPMHRRPGRYFVADLNQILGNLRGVALD